MAHTSSSKLLTYSICYGLVGGHLHVVKLHRLMQQSGYKYSKAAEADIIIAHSAGCWLIPPNSRAQLIMYVGMPLNTSSPRKTLKEANLLMAKYNSRWHTISRGWVSLLYGLAQPRRNVSIMRMARQAKPIIIPDVKAIFIVNQYDPWPKTERLSQLLENKDWSFINLAGTHDDIKLHPERYVEIINYYAGLLG